MTIRPFRPDDAPRLAEITQRCVREVNSRDYPADVIGRLCEHYTAEQYLKLSGLRLVYVAEDSGGRVVGTVSRDGSTAYSLFVDPDLAGRGIGRRLMGHIEALAARDGYQETEAAASITARPFYHRLGYVDVRQSETEFGLTYIVWKPLSGLRRWSSGIDNAGLVNGPQPRSVRLPAGYLRGGPAPGQAGRGQRDITIHQGWLLTLRDECRPAGHQVFIDPPDLAASGGGPARREGQDGPGLVQCHQAVDVAVVGSLDEHPAQVFRSEGLLPSGLGFGQVPSGSGFG